MYRVNLEKFIIRKLCDTMQFKIKRLCQLAKEYENYETVILQLKQQLNPFSHFPNHLHFFYIRIRWIFHSFWLVGSNNPLPTHSSPKINKNKNLKTLFVHLSTATVLLVSLSNTNLAMTMAAFKIVAATLPARLNIQVLFNAMNKIMLLLLSQCIVKNYSGF